MPNGVFVAAVTNSANSATVSVSPVAGETLVVFSATSAGAGNPVVTGAVTTGGGTVSLTQALATWNSSGANQFVSVYYLENCPAGITAVTFTYTGGAPGSIFLIAARYANLATSLSLQVAQKNDQASGVTPGTDALTSGAAVTPTAQPALVVGLGIGLTSGNAVSPGSTFGAGDWVSSGGGARLESKRITSLANQQTTFTIASGTDNFATIILIFSEPPAAPTGYYVSSDLYM